MHTCKRNPPEACDPKTVKKGFNGPYIVAMPVQYELRHLFHLMNIQTHRNSTQKALFLGEYFNSLLRS